MKQLAFLIVSSTPSLKKIAQNFNQLFLVESTYFHCFPYIYLMSEVAIRVVDIMSWSLSKD